MSRLAPGSVPLPDGVAERRIQNLATLISHLTTTEGSVTVDNSVPGADKIGRFAVVCRSSRGHGVSLTRCSSISRAGVVGTANISEGWHPLAAFDLDTLDGGEPPIEVGDVVKTETGETFPVAMVDDHGGERRIIGEDTRWAREHEVEVIERVEPDERIPVRHDVALVQTTVVFNTVASAS